MSKSFKFKNNYLDTKGIVHNKQLLSDILNVDLIDNGTNNTQGSWKVVPNINNKSFVVLIITKQNEYCDIKIIPKSLIQKYTPSSPLRLIHNSVIIVQIAWNNNDMVEYIWTSGYSIAHYSF